MVHPTRAAVLVELAQRPLALPPETVPASNMMPPLSGSPGTKGEAGHVFVPPPLNVEERM